MEQWGVVRMEGCGEDGGEWMGCDGGAGSHYTYVCTWGVVRSTL